MNDTRFHRSYTPTRPSSSSILVRVGERSWQTAPSGSETVTEHQAQRVLTIEKSATAPITLRAMRERIANAQREQQDRERANRWRQFVHLCRELLFPADEGRLWPGLRGGCPSVWLWAASSWSYFIKSPSLQLLRRDKRLAQIRALWQCQRAPKHCLHRPKHMREWKCQG
ncbi:hypothetical protein [Alicyclobacillus sacchari]|uniref:hypothetical protein n=1 Tax=Alicyclobacillus sacchari TaxID=392010 RepID=UPI0024E0F42B|nr:hypothetical protein [Alicyclobacillus sacchari]